MTFQPPPPGGNPPAPPPPPPGQWGPPPTGPSRPGGGFDPKTVNPLDWAILGISFLILIPFSFFGYYSFGAGGFSVSYGAWHTTGGTFLAWLAMIIGFLAGVPVALELFMPAFKLPIPSRLLSLYMFAASFILYIIAIFAHDDFGPDGGHGFSFWLSMILVLAGSVLSLMRMQQTGAQLPGPLANIPTIGGPRGSQGGAGPRPGPGPGPNAPPPGYGPPQ
jgi:uncharacterized membrane protein YidH (DUF202 family)